MKNDGFCLLAELCRIGKITFFMYICLVFEILEAVLNLFRDRLRPMLKQIGVRDRQSIAGY